MAWEPPEGMDEYLRATELCDCDNTELQHNAREIAGDADTAKEAAKRIFYFVRDEVPFGLDFADAKASHTLRKRIGFCMTKTNLQIALLRAVGIPARCHYSLVPKSLSKHIIPKLMYNSMPMAVGHPWCECYLSGRWISCEALADKPYHEGRLKFGAFTREEMPTIDWDGEVDLILYKPWLLEYVGVFPSWDDALMQAGKRREGRPPKNRLLGCLGFWLMNRRISQFRQLAGSSTYEWSHN